MSWCWVDKRLLLLLHDESLAEHGGATGMRDEGLLDSALAKPLNLLAYGDPDFADLAAAYALGLAKGHAFVDGNKRAAFLAVGLFLALNGLRLTASQADATLAMLALAAGEVTQPQYSDWVRKNSASRGPQTVNEPLATYRP
ncbi:MAG: type II toxin-antitoxin system death-on-curing family toxin [Burkholderiales bacterium]|jgi:death on curing protein|nr:type II toxin-antitoxin system death-on-curing family toxin [Burkholderiales bacterium]